MVYTLSHCLIFSFYIYIFLHFLYAFLAYKISCLSTCLAAKFVPPSYPKMEVSNLLPIPGFPPSSLSPFFLFPFCSHFVHFFTITDLDTLLSLLLGAPSPPEILSPRELRESVHVVRGRSRPAPKPWLLWAVRASSTVAWKPFQFLFCIQRLTLRKNLSRPILLCSIVDWSIS